MEIRFIDREYELKLLEQEWKQNRARFIILYGRRRIGKTRLLFEFLKNKSGFYWVAEDNNKKVQINDLKNKLAEFFKDDFLRKIELNEWNELFEYLERIIDKQRKFFIVLDEFSYLIKNGYEIASVMQKFIDRFLQKTKVFFIVSGSLFGLMLEKVLSSTSPLYGRRDRDILLTQLECRHALKFLPMKFEDKLKTYLIIGGIPEYLKKAHRYKTFSNFLLNEFFSKDGYFFREPYFLLSQEFKEIKTYFTILNAIAYGNVNANNIANFVGIKTREIYPYIENLIRLNFVKKEIPLFAKRKYGIYVIRDVMFDFWFNFVHKNREDIEEEMFYPSKSMFNEYFGKRFEIFIRDEVFHDIFKGFTKIGKWWYKDKEIDIVAINEKTKEILFAECKWKDNVDAYKVLQELKEKAKYVKWFDQERREFYAIFAKSFKNKVKEAKCIDLKELEKI
jgi:hypothetical protein